MNKSDLKEFINDKVKVEYFLDNDYLLIKSALTPTFLKELNEIKEVLCVYKPKYQGNLIKQNLVKRNIYEVNPNDYDIEILFK